jgi:hypothetical protein
MRRQRSGKVVLLTLFMMTFMLILMSFAYDIGWLFVTEAELQRTADSASMAAAWEFIDEDALTGNTNLVTMRTNATSSASEFCVPNQVLGSSPSLAVQDVEIGYMADPLDPASTIDTNSTLPPNAIRVSVQRTDSQNGAIPFSFARIFGRDETTRTAEATAVLLNNLKGFQPPSNNTNLPLLPIACDLPSWNNLVAGNGPDNWTWDVENQQIIAGSDNIRELNLYPKGNGSPGNRGTVDIGKSNNSTADISRQISHGVSAADLAYHGGKLEFDANGELFLNADTGISAGIKDELASIIGKPVFIPIFSSISGNGNNAMYKIVGFGGVRITEVKLTGKMNSKRVIIQPTNVITWGGIPAGTQYGNLQLTDYIYSPVWLAR